MLFLSFLPQIRVAAGVQFFPKGTKSVAPVIRSDLSASLRQRALTAFESWAGLIGQLGAHEFRKLVASCHFEPPSKDVMLWGTSVLRRLANVRIVST
jgi:hypothetical protein